MPRVSEDYAICTFAMPAVLPAALANLRYEVMESKKPLTATSGVLMTGLGCDQTAPDKWGDPKATIADHQLRVGDAVIDAAAPLDGGPDSNFLRIVSDLKQPALCPAVRGGR